MHMPTPSHGLSPDELEVQLARLENRARLILTARGGFDWLLNGPQFYSTQNVADAVNAVGMRSATGADIDSQVVIRWFNKISESRPEYTQDFGGSFGKRISRRGLLFWFADLLDQTPPLATPRGDTQ